MRLTPNNEALFLKEKGICLINWGNDHFKKKAYQNAIKCYVQALVKNQLIQNKNPNELAYYTNLALAYKADGQF